MPTFNLVYPQNADPLSCLVDNNIYSEQGDIIGTFTSLTNIADSVTTYLLYCAEQRYVDYLTNDINLLYIAQESTDYRGGIGNVFLYRVTSQRRLTVKEPTLTSISRCPYCNTKVISEATHCPSCAAPL